MTMEQEMTLDLPEWVPRLRGPGGRPLRVAHLTTVDMSLALLLATELEVDVLSGLRTFGISAPGPYVPQLDALGVEHLPLQSLTRSWDLRRDARSVGELARALRRLRLDVLHTHNPKTGVIGRVVGRAAGVPVVVNTCHGLWVQRGDRLAKKALVYGAEAAAARLSHAELYQNSADRDTLRRAVGARRAQVVGNGTDLARFRPDARARQRVRAELGVRDDELLVGGVGRLVAEKGIAEFGEAASALRHRARFVWVGPSDSDKPDAVAGAVAGIEMLGERTDMAAVYNALDVFVLPSYREGFSRSAMEAAACAKAMVLTDIRGCREIGEHERHLLLVAPRDACGLARVIERLLDDQDLRVRLADAALGRAQASFDQRRVAVESLRTYSQIARRRRLGWVTG
ncbi:MAG: glycosyltransferase [Actinomycetes bacterium]